MTHHPTMTVPDFEWDTTSEHCEDEAFQLMRTMWDVVKAKEILRQDEREIIKIGIEGLADYVGNPPGPDGKRKLQMMMISVDWDAILEDVQQHVGRFDLSIPIIAITKVLTSPPHEGQTSLFIIDGWHRIAKAKMLGLEYLPGVVLTVEESNSILC